MPLKPLILSSYIPRLPQHQPSQHAPQRLTSLPALLAQPLFNAPHQPLRFHPQLLNHARTVRKTAFALHIPERIPLDLLVRSFLLQDVYQDLVAGIGAYGVDDGEGEFSFCQVFTQAFERGVARCGGEVEVVVEDLE